MIDSVFARRPLAPEGASGFFVFAPWRRTIPKEGEGNRVKTNLSLTPAQAAALARLIQMQLDAYEETVLEAEGSGELPTPFTVADLELIELLVIQLRKASICTD